MADRESRRALKASRASLPPPSPPRAMGAAEVTELISELEMAAEQVAAVRHPTAALPPPYRHPTATLPLPCCHPTATHRHPTATIPPPYRRPTATLLPPYRHVSLVASAPATYLSTSCPSCSY
jgi:hypothetical protein